MPNRLRRYFFFPFLAALCASGAVEPSTTRPSTRPDTGRGDQMLADYFRAETAAIAGRCLADVKTLDDWNAKKSEYRRQLAEMLGLWPMPQKTDLQANVTSKTESEEFTVERLNFQSMPHLYVTGDLYLPKGLAKPAPAILYVCGHSKIKEKNISYGNKVGYQHHGEWFARNGYVCLVIDSLELGEIEGIHHGTYNLGMWWWQSRGYTPAGVEAWNGIRALDYLCSRPEVDATRIGMTGRSGGGAYTWYVSALDERVKVAAPVAGMTDLQNYVVDGCVEGHCDCMFMNNTYRWDYPQVAALIAPRPLLIGNSDKDSIFPLDGVYRLHEQVRRIYGLQGAAKNLGLLITEGPHKDTQDLQVPVFRWFNRFLKNEEGTVDKVATKFFEPAQLKVFDRLPDDQINSKIQETFVPMAAHPPAPASPDAWARQRDRWMSELQSKTFAGWPDAPPPLDLQPARSVVHDGIRLTSVDFTAQHDLRLRLYVAQPEGGASSHIVLKVLDEAGWANWAAQMRVDFEPVLEGETLPPPDAKQFDEWIGNIRSNPSITAWIAPRGIGPTAWNPDPKKQTHIKRRFALLGQTLDGMRVWDIRRAIAALRSIEGLGRMPLWLEGSGRMGGDVLYAALFEPGVARLDLSNLPKSHGDGPELLNMLQVLDMPATVAMVAERAEVHLAQTAPGAWEYPKSVIKQLRWDAGRLQIHESTE
jgi:dienelactone hydrolase